MITWKAPFEKGETRKLSLSYSVQNPISGLIFSTPDAHNPSRPSYVVTDHETERARYWLACVDYPTVRTTLAFNITVPNASYVALANGKETKVESGVSTWELNYPCPAYLITFALGEFIRVNAENVDQTPISYFAPVVPSSLYLICEQWNNNCSEIGH